MDSTSKDVSFEVLDDIVWLGSYDMIPKWWPSWISGFLQNFRKARKSNET